SFAAPPEPHDGGHLSISSPSFSLSIYFHETPVLTVPDTGQPQDTVDVSLTGYGASENVNVKIDGTPKLTMATDQFGSADGSLLLDTTFGRHSLSFVGAQSGLVRSHNILLKQWVGLDPSSGPTGSVVHVTSGPGWKPGEKVDVKIGGLLVGTVTADANG